MTLYDIYKYGLDDDSNDNLCNLYDYVESIIDDMDIYELEHIMTIAFERSTMFDIAIDIAEKDYDLFFMEFKEVSNADNMEKETGERPFWSKEDFEIWLSKVEVSA